MVRARSGRALRLGVAVGALALLGLLGAGHLVLWNALAGAIEGGMAVWAEDRRAAGWDVSHGPPERHGWPFAAAVRFPGLTIASGPASPVAFVWAAGTAEARITPPDLRLVEIDLPDAQLLLMEGTELRFAAERMVLRFRAEGGAPPLGGTLEASRLRVAAPGLLPGGAGEAASLFASLATRPDATEAEAALALSFAAQGVTLPVAGPLGRTVQEAALTLTAGGPVPGRRALRQRAETWRDAGGTVALSEVRLHYGPLRAEGEATLALDAALQPMGAGRIATTGHDAALSALAEAGVIARATAVQAGLALRLVQRVPEGGGAPRAEVPLLLEDRRLSVLGIPIARMPRLIWPAAPEAAQ